MVSKRKPPISPRKSPSQERSKTLVDAVLQATTRILGSMGYDKITTNRVAEAAGVSIGSLYQYFPNKDSIFAALIERHLEEHRKIIAAILEKNADQPTAVVIEKVTPSIVDLFVSKREFMKTLFSQLPRLEKTRDLLYSRNEVIELLAEFLESRKESLSISDIRLSLFILVNSVMGVVQTMIISDQIQVQQEVLVAEIVQLAKKYLLAPKRE